MQSTGGQAMTADHLASGQRGGGMARKLAILTGLASLGLAGFAVALIMTPGNPIQIKFNTPAASSTSTSGGAANVSAQLPWVAAAPGRVEPRSGQIRISAGIGGRVEKVAVKMNDRVAEGEVL